MFFPRRPRTIQCSAWHSHFQEKQEQKDEAREVHLIYQYPNFVRNDDTQRHKVGRQREINGALKQNLLHKYVTKVHLLLESEEDLKFLTFDKLFHPDKVDTIKWEVEEMENSAISPKAADWREAKQKYETRGNFVVVDPNDTDDGHLLEPHSPEEQQALKTALQTKLQPVVVNKVVHKNAHPIFPSSFTCLQWISMLFRLDIKWVEYKDVFQYANDNLAGKICVVMNADVFVSGTGWKLIT